MKAISAEPDLVKKLPAEAKDTLKDVAQKLAQATEKNALALRAAVSATQQLIQNIVAMVKVEMSAGKSYKNMATAHLTLGTYSPTCPPVSVSRSV
jgi:F0F1-type ATP synthase membrane subunit b/b'